MGMGQTMITALFFTLLTLMILNAINTLNKADQELMTTIAYKTAGDLAQSLMVEILTKKYDGLITSTNYPSDNSDVSKFTAPSSLGPETAEKVITFPDVSPFKSIGTYDDIDDYNGYSRMSDSTNGLAPFKDSVIVSYVQMTNPPTIYSGKWWTKMVQVWVTQNDYMSDLNSSTGARTYYWVKIYRVVGFTNW